MVDKNLFDEIGELGLKAGYGYLWMAYNKQLRWPQCQEEYERIRTTDPEISQVRNFFTALSGGLSVRWDMPNDPNDDDKKAVEFGTSVLEDIQGGMSKFIVTMMSQVPFFGWGWWEIVWGLRTKEYEQKYEWDIQSDDAKIGIRKLAFRDTSSFDRWELDDYQRVVGMWQRRQNQAVSIMIPAEKSVHIINGDVFNPEGVTQLGSVYRMEYIKRQLEMVQGMGYEHAAGHLKFNVENAELSKTDKEVVRAAAQAMMAAQEGNYATLPSGITAEMVDVPFSVAGSILQSIRFYSLLKLAAYQCQFLALGTTAETGAYSAMQEGFNIFLTYYNAMVKSYIDQFDEQVVARIFRVNPTIPTGGKRPQLKSVPINRTFALDVVGQFAQAIRGVIRLGERDEMALRKASEILPEQIPTEEETISTPVDPGTLLQVPRAQMDQGHEGCVHEARAFHVDIDEWPTDVTSVAILGDPQSEGRKAVNDWKAFCKKAGRDDLIPLINARVNETGEGLE